MSDSVRDYFGLTQERLASWLGVNRTTLAMAETGRRSLPLGVGLQQSRLEFAKLNLVYDGEGHTAPAPPPLPPPASEAAPLAYRLEDCRYHMYTLNRQLTAMRKRAAQFEARLAALPGLRAWTQPVKNPAREAGWLALFEGEAVDGLRDDCGAGPQLLLAARIAGLEREAELLAEVL